MTDNMMMVRTLIKPQVIAKDGVNPKPVPRMSMAEMAKLEVEAAGLRDRAAYRPGGVPRTISDKTQQQIDQERRFQEQVDGMGEHVRNNSGQTVAEMMAALGWTDNRVRDIIRRALTEYPQIRSKLTRRNNTRVTVYNWEGE